MTSYVRTTSATVTRAEDNTYLATSGFALSGTVNSFVVSATTARGSGTQVLFSLHDTTANEVIRVERNSSNEIHVVVVDGGVTQADINLTTVANNTAFKVAVMVKANSVRASLNGGSIGSDATVTLPTVTRCQIGRGNAGSNWGGPIGWFKTVPREFSDAELQSDSTP